MRFVLDEDVDARLRRDITDEGHDCWTIPASGLGGEQDPNVAVYAVRLDAVLVTNDKEFANRHRRRLIGQFVYLKCADIQCREVMMLHLGDLVLMLERHEHLFAAVSREGIEYVFANQAWP